MGKQKLVFYPEKLRDIRIKKGITQLQISKVIGVSRTTFNKWENSVTTPKEKYINSIALFLKIERSEISNLSSVKRESLVNPDSLLEIGRDIRTHSAELIGKRETTLEYIKDIYHLAEKIDSFYFMLNAIFRGTIYPIYIKNAKNEYITANDAFFELAKLDHNFQLSGKNDSDIFIKDEATENKAIDQYVMDSNKVFKEIKYLPNSKQEKVAIWAKVPMYDKEKNIIGILRNIIDINEQKKFELAHDLITEALGKLSITVSITNVRKHYVTYYTGSIEEVFGIDSKLDGKTAQEYFLSDIVHPDDREEQKEYYESSKFPPVREYRIIHPKKGLRKIRAITYVVKRDNEDYSIALSIDITK